MARNPPRAPPNQQEGFVGGRGHGRGNREGRGGRLGCGSTARAEHHQQHQQVVVVDVEADTDLLASGLTFVGFPDARQKVREALNHSRF